MLLRLGEDGRHLCTAYVIQGDGETADVKWWGRRRNFRRRPKDSMRCYRFRECLYETDLFTELFFAQFVQCKELLSQNDVLYKTATGKFHSHDDLERIVVNKL